MRHNQKLLFFVVIIAVATSGCDMINSIKEYFSKDKKKAVVEAPAPTPVASEPVAAVEEQKAPAPTSPSIAANELARIGSWSITESQFNDRLKAIKEVVPDFDVTDQKAKALVLEELVRQQLLVTEAENQGLDKKQEIKDALEEFRRTILVREMAGSLTKGIDVTETEAKAFFDENKANLVEPPKIHVREIKTDTEEKAKAIVSELVAGADFATTATQKSMAKSAANGGDLGVLKELPFPEMAEPLQSLVKGQISGVIKGPDGFYIIKVEDKVDGAPLEYEKIKQDIIQNRKLFKQQQIILDHLKELESKYKVELNKDLLKGN